MPRIIHFEILAEDPERAIEFYRKVFGWEIHKWEGPFDYWLVTTGEDDEPGINGAIMSKEMGEMVKNTIGVNSFEEYAQKIVRCRGKDVNGKTGYSGCGYNGCI